MGPMGNYMTLLQLARGRGGYGGPQGMGGYGMPRGPMGYGGYGGPPGASAGQQGYGMQGMAPGGMSNAQMMQAAGDQTGGYAGLQQLQAQRTAMEQAQPQPPGGGPMGELSSASMGPAAPQYGMQGMAADPDNPGSNAALLAAAPQMNADPGFAAAQAWQARMGQGAYPGMNTAYNPMGLRGRRRFY